VLAIVHLHVGAPARAQMLVESVLAHVLEHCSLHLQGRSFLILAKCIIARCCGAAATSSAERSIQKSLHLLSRALFFFDKVQHFPSIQEVCYLQACLWNEVPDSLGQRDQAARQFLSTSG
jgi:hypothetical protein